jgi:N-methylhydantoinase B
MPGTCGRFLLNPDTPDEKVVTSKVSEVLVGEGDVISAQTAGGGGFGNPLAREPSGVASDYRLGKVTLHAVRHHFGVVLTEQGEVDQEATLRLRTKMLHSQDR